MKTLPSRLFPNCAFSAEEAAGFYDIIPQGYTKVVSLFLSKETVADDEAIQKAAVFFDRVQEWDAFGRAAFLSAEEGSEDDEMVAEYFDFYKEEAPDVFGDVDISALTLADMVNGLELCGMATHGCGEGQHFVVDFTLGYDQMLCVSFDVNSECKNIAWES